ncbi:MAG: TonB-dependent receptor [Ignavibacteria bacterium]|nr:TonB-dependent receptor [Ignavibacteria bacterium]
MNKKFVIFNLIFNRTLVGLTLMLIYFNLSIAQQNTTIAGVVTEVISGQAVIGTNVILYEDSVFTKPPFRGAATNRFGFYSLPNVPAGEYFLVARSIGYKSSIKKVKAAGENSIRINFEIAEEEVVLPEVVVREKRGSEIAPPISSIDVSPELLKTLPSLTGEVDLFRTLQLLPGIKVATEISTGLYVRGGSPDQTLTLLDGVIVYNPAHMGNFASTFNTEAINDIRLIKGAFPAQYGGRLSSVLDVKLREGTKEQFTGKMGVGLINSNLFVEGPLTDNSTFMFSGRRMYYDVLQGALYKGSILPRYNFFDVNGKISFKINESHWLSVSGLMGEDRLYNSLNAKDIGYDINWGNTTMSLNWTQISNPTLFSNTSLSYTNYDFDVLLEDKSGRASAADFFASTKLQDFLFKRETEFFPIEEHTIRIGTEITLHRFRLVSSDFFLSEIERGSGSGNDQLSLEAVAYASDEWKIIPELSTNIGARLYYFKERKKLSIEPRISLTLALMENVFFKGAYARAHQFLHLIVRNDVSLPTDIWYPSNERIEPARSDQFVGGIESYLFNEVYLFSIEGYYKNMQNLLEYSSAATFSIDTEVEDQLVVGKGEAYGIEIFLQKRAGDLNGWIGYTISWTRRLFDELNRGQIFYPRYDRRHDVSIVLSYSLFNHWNISATWTYGTGQAYTLPTGQYYFNEIGGTSNQNIRFNYLERNAFRLPAYHKLDLSISYKFRWLSSSMNATFGLFNVYNRKNPFAQYISFETNEAGEKIPKLKQLTLFPFMPTLSINFTF